jgi:hypothetical protein
MDGRRRLSPLAASLLEQILPNRRIFADHPLSIKESNQRRYDATVGKGLCYWCKQVNERAPKKYCLKCEGARAFKAKALLKVRKRELFEHYGGAVCACCGEQELAFLTLDHFTRHKNLDKYRGGDRLYRWLRLQGFPPGYRVLCFNCNVGRWINGGKCPHAN